MKLLLSLIFLTGLFGIQGCAQQQTTSQPVAVIIDTTLLRQTKQRTLDSMYSIKMRKQYSLNLDSLEQNRLVLQKRYLASKSLFDKRKVLKEAGEELRSALVKKIYPAWYGTVWDYNGISEVPGKGMIACGYFVSTTLKQAGLKLNRYKLAQQYSHSIVKSVGTEVKKFDRFADLLSYIKNHQKAVFVVGLDNHVGILVNDEASIKFVHSSYVSPGVVTSENAYQSSVLAGSSLYVVGSVTSNESLLVHWLMGERLL